MCGITGFLDLAASSSDSLLRATADRMATTLYHRGPDDGDVWADERAGVAFGFRRLAILDLSVHGRQPMHSACGRYTIAFNGEIYNFRELRRELLAHGSTFRGHADTEVLLAAVVQWGIAGAVRRLNGMFAFALWDSRTRCLHLVRDRIGKKPLYYGWAGRVFLFGSELKALRAHPAFRGVVDREALSLYMTYGYIPAPHTIYAGFAKLRPGTMLEVGPDRRATPAQSYWSLETIAREGVAAPLVASDDEVSERLHGLLMASVKARMIADVPLGAFLSGGTDSSLVVALMQAQSSSPVRTFTIGFDESGFDEAPQARAVAERLGTDHTELYVSPAHARTVIPDLSTVYDEPFADSSQIPTILVSQLARRHVTVGLSGDGGDELLGGYARYMLAQRVWSKLRLIPGSWRGPTAAALLRAIVPLADRAGGRSVSHGRSSSRAEKAERLSRMLGAATPELLYREIVSFWPASADIVIAERQDGHPKPHHGRFRGPPFGYEENMMYQDAVNYLPEDILTKVDRASMSVGLEVRAPLLDYRIVELAWRLPLRQRIRAGEGKWLLRKMLANEIGPELVDRPKQGFDVPIAEWLRGPLRDWAEDLLHERGLSEQGFLRPAPIRARWQQHMSGGRGHQQALWSVLMFQSWMRDQEHAGSVGS